MSQVNYTVPGDAAYQARLYPPPGVIDPNPPPHSLLGRKIETLADVIAHYTLSSLRCDGIAIEAGSLSVTADQGRHTIQFTPQAGFEAAAASFAAMHERFLDEPHAGQAMLGEDLLRSLTFAWNPMAGYPVNTNPKDGDCKWRLFLPLGMGMLNHRAVTLLHYPPYAAMVGADYLHNMTLERWQRLLACNDLTGDEHWRYDTFVDVNPIAAPGSGQSEYPNDYFPIMMASACFDADPGMPGGSYIRSMLDLLLNPPSTAGRKYTLPMLIGGSDSYDPQAPGWFRVRYKDAMPQDHTKLPPGSPGIPQARILQAGEIRLLPDSPRPTPYMIVNHMIAAGVEGRCTPDPAAPPDIRLFEAQDLVAAAFLKAYADDPDMDPRTARAQACLKWFGNAAGTGAPAPTDPELRLRLCALAQVDLFFDPDKIAPVYSYDEAYARCKASGGLSGNPCACGIAPPDQHCDS